MKTIALTLVALAIIGIGFFGIQTYTQQMKNAAVSDCLNIAKTQTVIKGDPQTQTFTQPDGAWYEKCLKDKGYKK